MGQFDKVNRQLGLDIKEGDQLDWIKQSARHIILCYDPNQSVRPSDILPNKVKDLNAINYTIKSQMRVLGGNDYIEYIDNLLHQQQKEKQEFKGYELYLFDSFKELERCIKEKEAQHKLCRIVAGYAWPWKSKKDSNTYDILLEGKQYKWNSTNQDWINSPHALDEIGCIHTIQGYDLNYVGVIIGHEMVYEKGNISVIPDAYHDKYGKQTIEDINILKAYILNIYKTLLTRGIKGTYIYICNENLREYFKQFIPLYKAEVVYDVTEIIEYVAEETVKYNR
ncbi:MAG: DUF2075 domain-containing protein, partial [Clostridium sp.]|nr:DUF2075 domain-containing protein [Clostridium sp.]